MNEWEIWGEEQRQRNFAKEQQRLLEEARKADAKVLDGIGAATGGAVGGIIGLFFTLVSFALIILFFILKYLFIFLIFLRNRFFIKWNWYAKTENAIKKCLLFIQAVIIWIIALPFVILFRHFDLCIVIGVVLLKK